jgi:hypothetical protein
METLPGKPPPSPPSSPDSQPSHSHAMDHDEESSLDTTKLRSVHNTQGYRDGISTSKEKMLQVGFDQGFYVGAGVGGRIGRIVGLLDGLVQDTVVVERGRGDGMRKEIQELREKARRELSIESVFGREFVGENGRLLWLVRGQELGDGQKEQMVGDGEGWAEYRMIEAAASHPLVRKWSSIVEELAGRVGLRLDGFELWKKAG